MILNPILPALLSAPLPVLHLLLFLLLLLFFFMYPALALTAEWYPGALSHQQLSIRTLSKAMGGVPITFTSPKADTRHG